MCEPSGRPILDAMIRTYGGLLDAIEASGFDVCRRRIGLGRWRRMQIVLGALSKVSAEEWSHRLNHSDLHSPPSGRSMAEFASPPGVGAFNSPRFAAIRWGTGARPAAEFSIHFASAAGCSSASLAAAATSGSLSSTNFLKALA